MKEIIRFDWSTYFVFLLVAKGLSLVGKPVLAENLTLDIETWGR